MSHGTQIPTEPPSNGKEENNNESFGEWAKNQIPFIITQVISILLAIGTFIYYVSHGEETITHLITIEQAEHLMYYLNLSFCIFCVIKLLVIYPDNSMGEFSARKIYKRVFQTKLTLGEHRQRFKQSMYLLSRFKLYFLCFWIVMVALYATFTVKTSSHSEKPPKGKVVREDKTIKTTYLIEIKDKENKSYDSISRTEKHSILDDGTTNEIKSIETIKDEKVAKIVYPQKIIHSTLEALGNKWDIMLTYSLNTISVMFILWCFAVTAIRAQNPSDFKQKPLLIYLSLFFTAILVALYPLCISLASHSSKGHIYYDEESLTNYSALFDAVSGVINAVVFALFIARLDSKFVSLPSKLIGILYLYSAVQPLFLVFDLPGFLNEAIKVSVLILVFFLKIYFFFIITYAIQKGKILAYLYCFGILSERVESIVKNPYKICIIHEEGQSHSYFNFNICINDFIMFKGHNNCDSQDECLSIINYIRLVASLRKNYYIEYVADDWYIYIKDENKKLYCSSYLSITSDKEGEEIIKEAIKKIPHCPIVLHNCH